MQRIALVDADIRIDTHWLSMLRADALLAELRSAVTWEVHRIGLFGREVDSPRLSCWIGDPDTDYTYSGTRFAPHAWPGALLAIRQRLHEVTGVDFNSVLANRYRDGRDAMGWHSDAERALGAQPVIASLSLGATRRFLLKHRGKPSLRTALDLPHGSLLLMAGDTQRNYKHALPRTAKPVAERINLTFRRIVL
ncbi:MAG: alpha-ketoglutarate-dependent dioxygenase AlkB family protein [Luteimonas sp.]